VVEDSESHHWIRSRAVLGETRRPSSAVFIRCFRMRWVVASTSTSGSLDANAGLAGRRKQGQRGMCEWASSGHTTAVHRLRDGPHSRTRPTADGKVPQKRLGQHRFVRPMQPKPSRFPSSREPILPPACYLPLAGFITDDVAWPGCARPSGSMMRPECTSEPGRKREVIEGSGKEIFRDPRDRAIRGQS
jgi:hypothetical protein